METQEFRSASGRAKVVVWLFIAGIVMALVSFGSDVAEIELLQRMNTGDNWTMAEADSNDTRTSTVAILSVIVLLAGALAFLVWLYRVSTNVAALGIDDTRWGPKWAVGWWFIPIMNLFRPYQVVKEIWKAYDPAARPGAWRDAAVPGLLGWWWASFLIASGVANGAGRAAMRGSDTIDAYMLNTTVYAVSEILWVIATIPAIMVVKEIDRRQTARHAEAAHMMPTMPHEPGKGPS